MAEQLTLFQDSVQIIEKNGITMQRCDKDFVRWITPNSPCPMCHPTTETVICDTCGSEFTDDRRMTEHQRISGNVQCDICLPRITPDDCRDQDRLHREAEDRRLAREAQRQAAAKLHPVIRVDIEE